MKKFLFLLFLSIFLFFNTENSFAAPIRIGIIVHYEHFEMNAVTKQTLFTSLEKLFPKRNYQISQNSELDADLSRMLSGKLLKNQELSIKTTLLALSEKYNYNCILLLAYSLDNANNNTNFLNWQKNAQVTLKVRMIQQKKANYIYDNDIIRKDAVNLKKLKDLAEISDVASQTAHKCNDHLFSDLELPLTKRTLEL